MGDQEQDRSVEEEPNSDEEVAATGYESPAIVVLGSIDHLTAQENGTGRPPIVQ